MSGSKHEQLLREQRLAEQERPMIIADLRGGSDPLEIAGRVAARAGIDERTAYKWVITIADDFTRRRRRIVVAGLVLLWLGVLAAASGALLGLFGVEVGGPPVWLTGLAAGVPVAVIGGLAIRFAPDLVRRSV